MLSMEYVKLRFNAYIIVTCKSSKTVSVCPRLGRVGDEGSKNGCCRGCALAFPGCSGYLEQSQRRGDTTNYIDNNKRKIEN